MRRSAGAQDTWVQDGTGDCEAYYPPLGAQLPGGWTVVRSTTHAGGVIFFNQGRYERGEPAISITELPEMLLQVESLAPAEAGGAPAERPASLRLAQPPALPAAAAPALPGAAHALYVEDEEAAAWGERHDFSVANPMARAAASPAEQGPVRGASSASASASANSFMVHNPLRRSARGAAEEAPPQQQQAAKAPHEGCTPV
jgi:hypothetical protein